VIVTTQHMCQRGPLVPGDRVVIRKGVFREMEGEVIEVDVLRGIVRVRIKIFDRDAPVEVGVGEVERLP